MFEIFFWLPCCVVLFVSLPFDGYCLVVFLPCFRVRSSKIRSTSYSPCPSTSNGGGGSSFLGWPHVGNRFKLSSVKCLKERKGFRDAGFHLFLVYGCRFANVFSQDADGSFVLTNSAVLFSTGTLAVSVFVLLDWSRQLLFIISGFLSLASSVLFLPTASCQSPRDLAR